MPRLSPPRALALFALWLVATLGVRPLLLPDEGRYAGVARDMLLRGDWLTPRLNGLPFFHKPPLMYWIDMASMSVLGINPFSARIASFVGAWVLGASIFFAARRWHGAQAALATLLALATMPFVYIGAQYANHDMLVAGFITATVLAFVRAVDEPQVSLRWVVAAWALAALAALSKGLIGIVLPALVVGPWLLWQGRWREVLRLLHPAGLLTFAVIALPWFAAMQWRYPGFFDYFIVEQHFRRFAIAKFNNQHPAWFYLVTLPLLTLPWSAWLPAAVREVWRRRREPDAARRALHVWWIVAIVGFFSLPSSKLVGYVMPALAPLALLLATAAMPTSRRLRAAALAGGLMCLAATFAIAWKAPNSAKPAANVLMRQMQPGDRIVFVRNMFFDLPFYAHLSQPVLVADDWDSPDVQQRDNWRKEMADAARFDPAQARMLLVPVARLAQLACHPQAVWFVMEPGTVPEMATVPDGLTMYADGHVVLVRAPGRRC